MKVGFIPKRSEEVNKLAHCCCCSSSTSAANLTFVVFVICHLGSRRLRVSAFRESEKKAKKEEDSTS